ncbi:MAG: hypothetical protein ACUVSK_09720 [Desulfotomaculales bacterium]
MDKVFQRVMWALTLTMPVCVFLGLAPGYFYWLFTGDGVTAKQVTRFGVKAGLVSALFFPGCLYLYASVAFYRLLQQRINLFWGASLAGILFFGAVFAFFLFTGRGELMGARVATGFLFLYVVGSVIFIRRW